MPSIRRVRRRTGFAPVSYCCLELPFKDFLRFGAAVGALVTAQFDKQLEEAMPRQSGVATTDGESGKQRSAGGVVFANQLFQRQRCLVNPMGRRNLGARNKVAVTQSVSSARAIE